MLEKSKKKSSVEPSHHHFDVAGKQKLKKNFSFLNFSRIFFFLEPLREKNHTVEAKQHAQSVYYII